MKPESYELWVFDVGGGSRAGLRGGARGVESKNVEIWREFGMGKAK